MALNLSQFDLSQFGDMFKDMTMNVDMNTFARPMRQSRPRQAPRPALQSWGITKFELGHLDKGNNFSIEYKHTFPRGGKLETDPNERRVNLVGGAIQVQIGDHSIHKIHILDSDPTGILLVLDHSPFFGYRFSADRQMSRSSSIDSEHASLDQAVNRFVLVSFVDAYTRHDFCDADRRRSLPKPRIANISLVQRGRYSSQQMSRLQAVMAKLPGPIAFQVHSLVLSGLVTPNDMLRLAGTISRLGVERGAKEAERVLVSFSDRVQRAQIQARRGPRKQRQVKTLDQHFADATNHVTATLAGKDIQNTCMTRFAIVTPTGVLLDGPVVEQSNATLRLYPQHTDLFLRVSFREEDHSTFNFSSEWRVLEFLRQRYKAIFTEGLHAAGRVFHFLGWSSAGLKQQTALFVAPFTINGTTYTAEMVRQKMGNFTRCEDIPAKWMARVGQTFSTTKRAVDLEPEQVLGIPDLAPPNSPWVYTDGVGTISPRLAEAVETALNADATAYDLNRQVPSTTFQVRIGGAKGMLSVDPTLTGRKACLRDSMIKFDAAGTITLNIASTFGRPSPAFANRPLIQVLEGLGVPAQVFLDLQRAAIRQTEEAKTTWRGMSGLLDVADLGRAARVPGVLKWLASVLAAQGAITIEDEFFRQCTNLAVMHSHRQLKFRARIPLPGCWTLVGVVDEEPGGYLREDEIYACVHEAGKDPVFLEGIVAISRSPVVHPGDVRLKNCVVFSVKGSRPLPSMLGGGDCDGDVYQILTLPSLLPKRMMHPGSYDAPKPDKLGRASTVDDAAEFFLNFVMLDCVGQVSTRHLHWADYSSDGVGSASCMLLAQAHSTAIDYPKTGVPVPFMTLPRPPPKKPDFSSSESAFIRFGKPAPNTYESSKALGQLFRMIGADLIQPTGLAAWRGGERTAEDDEDEDEFSADEMLDPSGTITKALKAALGLGPVDASLTEEMRGIMARFADDLHRIARVCSLTRDPLSEHELLLGTIAGAARSRLQKKECSERLAEAITLAFAHVRREVAGGEAGEGGDLQEAVGRCWAGWVAAAEGEQEWGTATFGWVVLGALMEAVEEVKREGREGKGKGKGKKAAGAA